MMFWQEAEIRITAIRVMEAGTMETGITIIRITIIRITEIRMKTDINRMTERQGYSKKSGGKDCSSFFIRKNFSSIKKEIQKK